ncbi:MAG: hypothetical protein H0U86_01520 [Chloroflexi bacterium]|nr:hypothetical protein [Chloroflexota bacterium]
MGVALVLAFTACAAPVPVRPGATAPPRPSPTATPRATASPTAGPTDVALPAPGRPFDAETILTAMRDSRRPGGVPDQLETAAIASALAEAIWTYDGRPWTTMAASGSCGAETCTLELAGARPGSQGDDLWIFDVRPADGTVEVATAELRGLPADLRPSLDALARSLLPDAALEGLLLTNARWLPPPDDGQFELAYRGDGEEGSCVVDLTLDAATPAIVGDPPGGC